MDSIFFHPKIVHLPMALAVLMPLVGAGLAVAWWRAWLPARGWVIAVVLQALLVGSSIAALRTGEAEEEVVERVVAESRIEAHEEAAEAFTIAAGVVLGLMVLALGASRTRVGLPVALAATVGTTVVFGLGYQTGQAGGELVYRYGAAAAPVSSAPGAPGVVRRSHDDDDD